MSGAAAALVAAVAPLLPRAAEACAVCMSGREDETKNAFLLGTLLLSALPFALVGGLVLWVRRRGRELAVRDELRAGETARG